MADENVAAIEPSTTPRANNLPSEYCTSAVLDPGGVIDSCDEDPLRAENISNGVPVSVQPIARDNDPAGSLPSAVVATEDSNDGVFTAQPMDPSPTGDVQIITHITNAISGISLLTPSQLPPRDEQLVLDADNFTYWPTIDEWHEFTPDGYETATSIPPQSLLRCNAPEFVPGMINFDNANANSTAGHGLPSSSTLDFDFRLAPIAVRHPQRLRPCQENGFALQKGQSFLEPFFKREAEKKKLKIQQEERAGLRMAEERVALFLVEDEVSIEQKDEFDTSYLTLKELMKMLSPTKVVEAPPASQDNSQQGLTRKCRLYPSVWPHDIPTKDDERFESLREARWTEAKLPAQDFPTDLKGFPPFLFGNVPSDEEDDDQDDQDDQDDNVSIITNPYEDDDADQNDRYHLVAEQAEQCDVQCYRQYDFPNWESSAMAERRLAHLAHHHACADPADLNSANGVTPPASKDTASTSPTKSHGSVTSTPSTLKSHNPPQPTPSKPRVGAEAPPSPANSQGKQTSVSSIPRSQESPSVPSQSTPNASRASSSRTPPRHPDLDLYQPPRRRISRESSQEGTPTGASLPSPPNTPAPRPSPQQLADLGPRDSWGLPVSGRPQSQAGRSSNAMPALLLQAPQQQAGAPGSSQRPAPPAGAPTGPRADRMNRRGRGWGRGRR